MSNNPNILARILIYVKNIFVLSAAALLAAIFMLQVSVDVLGGSPDFLMGNALFFIGAYALPLLRVGS